MTKEKRPYHPAMLILEGIVIFYYSLGILNHIIGEQKWEETSSMDKLLFGFGLAIFIPLGVHFLMNKNVWVFGIVCLTLALSAVIYAFVIILNYS